MRFPIVCFGNAFCKSKIPYHDLYSLKSTEKVTDKEDNFGRNKEKNKRSFSLLIEKLFGGAEKGMVTTNESHYERINLACKMRDHRIPIKAMYLDFSRVSG